MPAVYPDVPITFERSDGLADAVGYDVYLLREDRFPLLVGGSKARKMVAFINEVDEVPGHVITVGSLQSNHVRATIAWAESAGATVDLVLHDGVSSTATAPPTSTAIRHMRVVAPSSIGETVREFEDRSRSHGERFVTIPGGGHHPAGARAYCQVGRMLRVALHQQGIVASRVIVASGTGGTQGGLIAGCGLLDVVGISVGRPSARALGPIRVAAGWAGCDEPRIHFIDDFLFQGYGTTTPELLETCDRASALTDILVEPTYMGRVFHAMLVGHPSVRPLPGSAVIIVVSG